jgi:hypothetical protein
MSGMGMVRILGIFLLMVLLVLSDLVWAQRPNPGQIEKKSLQEPTSPPVRKPLSVTAKTSIDTVNPSTATLEPGGTEVTVEIKGTGLNNVTGVEILSHGTVPAGVEVRLGPVSQTLVRLTIKAGKDVKPGDYLLRVVAAGQAIDLPGSVAVVKIGVPGKPVLLKQDLSAPSLPKETPVPTTSGEGFQPAEIKVSMLKVIGKPGGPPAMESGSVVFQPVAIALKGLKVIGLPGGPAATQPATGPFVPVTVKLSGLKVIGKPGGPPPQEPSTGPFVPVTINVHTLKVIGK